MSSNSQVLAMLNNWNFWDRPIDKAGIERDITVTILKYLHEKKVISLAGVRRSGKSTIFFQIAKKLVESGIAPSQILYVNFEDPFFAQNNDLTALEKIYQVYREEINNSAFPYIFFDEIQNIEQWEKWVRTKTELDEAKIFVTGSSSKLLSSEFASILTGRNILFNIFPLSFSEYLRFKGHTLDSKLKISAEKTKIRPKLKEYLLYGGFPETFFISELDKKEVILKQYFDDIIYKDIVQRHQIRDVRTLKGLAVQYLTGISALSSYNKIKNSTGIPIDVIRTYTSYMTESFLLSELPRFSYKVREQQMSPKKIYAVDTGLRNYVAFRFIEDTGKLAENAVYSALKARGDELYYHKNTKETDFLVKKGLKITEAIQVSFSDLKNDKTRQREIDGLKEAMSDHGLKNGTIVTDDYEDEIKVDGMNIHFVPLWIYLLGA